MSLSKRLKEERLRLHLNQEAFAKLGHVSRVSQVNYESGERKPDSAYLESLSQNGVDVGYVISGQRAVSSKPAEELMVSFYGCIREIEKWLKKNKKTLSDEKLLEVAILYFKFKTNNQSHEDLADYLKIAVNA